MQRFILYCSIAILAGSATTRELSAQDSTAKTVDSTAKAVDTAAVAVADTTAAMPSDSAAAQPVATATDASISLASVAGKWNMTAMNDVGDVPLMAYNMIATADSSGWSYGIAKRARIPVRITAVDGDSIIAEAGPYESISRKGIKVTLYSVMRLQDDKLVGTSIAHYATTGADSVLAMQLEGTRAP